MPSSFPATHEQIEAHSAFSFHPTERQTQTETLFLSLKGRRGAVANARMADCQYWSVGNLLAVVSSQWHTLSLSN